MTTKSIACCGLECDKCRAYLATRNMDQVAATEIAKLWSNPEEGDYTPDDIWCDGCHSNRLHSFCAKCHVRTCVNNKRLDNCGCCLEYPCNKLKSLWGSWVEASPAEARANLEETRQHHS